MVRDMSRTRRPARRSGHSARKVALDVETTGLSAARGHRVIEIGCVEIVDREITGRVFHRYVDPERDIDERAQRVHGIDRERLRGEPKFAEVLDELLEFVRNAEVLVHNARFDLGFLDAELRHAGRAESFRECCRKVTDTLPMTRQMFPDSGHRLDDLCDLLGVDRSDRTRHGALLDAQLLAEVYMRIAGVEEPGQKKDAEQRKSAPSKKAAAKHREEIIVQLPYGTGAGPSEDASPATVEELSKLHWALAKKIQEANPGMSHDVIHGAALDATRKTVEETVSVGLAMPPTADAQEQYERRVSRHIEWRQRRAQRDEIRAQWRALVRLAPWGVALVLVGLLFGFPGWVILLLFMALVAIGGPVAMAFDESRSGSGSVDGQQDRLRAGAETRRAASYARTLVRRTKSRRK